MSIQGRPPLPSIDIEQEGSTVAMSEKPVPAVAPAVVVPAVLVAATGVVAEAEDD